MHVFHDGHDPLQQLLRVPFGVKSVVLVTGQATAAHPELVDFWSSTAEIATSVARTRGEPVTDPSPAAPDRVFERKVRTPNGDEGQAGDRNK